MTDEDLIHADASPDLSQSGQQSSVPPKTMGEIAFEAAHDTRYWSKYPWDSASDTGRKGWQAAADAVIEECAKIADDWVHSEDDDGDLEGEREASAACIAAAIRSLKSNPKGEDHDGS